MGGKIDCDKATVVGMGALARPVGEMVGKGIAVMLRIGLLLLPLAACGSGDHISIRPGSTADSLIFDLETTSWNARSGVSFALFRLDTCDALRNSRGIYPRSDQTAWMLEAVIGEAPPVDSIRYGRAPWGYQTVRPPIELERPGCYVAEFSRKGLVGLDVDASGVVRQVPASEVRKRLYPREP